MSKNKVITTTTFNGHPVIGENKTFDYNNKYLQKNQELLDSTINRHNKVMAVRMDLKYPQNYPDTPSPQHISQAMQTYTRELSRDGLDPQYVTRQEQKNSAHPHIHIALLVNASETQRYKHLTQRMAPHWGRAIGVENAEALVWPCDRRQDGKPQENGTIIRRNAENAQEQYDKVFKQISYLAKSDPDDVTPSHQRRISYSRYNRGKSRVKR